MLTPTRVKSTIQYLFLSATRGLLEDNLRWFYREMGSEGRVTRVNRLTLEKLFFISNLLDIQNNSIYQVFQDGIRIKQAYLSGSETLSYIVKHTDIPISEEWDGTMRDTKTEKLITIRYVCSDKEMR